MFSSMKLNQFTKSLTILDRIGRTVYPLSHTGSEGIEKARVYTFSYTGISTGKHKTDSNIDTENR